LVQAIGLYQITGALIIRKGPWSIPYGPAASQWQASGKLAASQPETERNNLSDSG